MEQNNIHLSLPTFRRSTMVRSVLTHKRHSHPTSKLRQKRSFLLTQHSTLQSERLAVPLRWKLALILLGFLLVLLLALPWLSAADRPLVVQQLSGFLRSGALVFGGEHVLIPLLEQSLVPHSWIGLDQFLARYGFAQALPGPIFSFTAFLGFDLRRSVMASMARLVMGRGDK